MMSRLYGGGVLEIVTVCGKGRGGKNKYDITHTDYYIVTYDKWGGRKK